MMTYTNSKLALLGGAPIRKDPLPAYNTIGQKEMDAALEVMKTGVLSGFVASPNENYYGGKWTLELEAEFCKFFGTKYAVAVNSATSGLHAALAAAGISEGDEVITSPYTMSASATAAVMCGGIPVFVDIEPETFCLNPKLVEVAITKKTKAIMAVNIFGQPADLKQLRKIADKHNLILVEDNAQAPAAKYQGQWTATIGDMGVFSLNRHKTMHCGEGGVVVCNNENLARRLQMVRNHGEVVLMEWPQKLQGFGNEDIVGYNYRLTELQCAIVIPQFKRLTELNQQRIELANYLRNKMKKFSFIKAPLVRENCTHVYYLFPMIYDPKDLGIKRDLFVKAMQAEGMTLANYVKPLIHIPLYHKRGGKRSCYQEENFPVVQKLWKENMIVTSICRPPLNKEHMDEFIYAIEKVADSANQLKEF